MEQTSRVGVGGRRCILLTHPNHPTCWAPEPAGFVPLPGALAALTGRGLGIPASLPAVLTMWLGCTHPRSGWEDFGFSAKVTMSLLSHSLNF